MVAISGNRLHFGFASYKYDCLSSPSSSSNRRIYQVPSHFNRRKSDRRLDVWADSTGRASRNSPPKIGESQASSFCRRPAGPSFNPILAGRRRSDTKSAWGVLSIVSHLPERSVVRRPRFCMSPLRWSGKLPRQRAVYRDVRNASKLAHPPPLYVTVLRLEPSLKSSQ
jgi:hypothetical protein